MKKSKEIMKSNWSLSKIDKETLGVAEITIWTMKYGR